ncbi:MAG: DotG/IcmE/VirB10 family protein [Proteobacteria bacterium]|nr:DotG/IcmE/VirB10 family protein [Pseudomonadota bacterium]
MADDDKPIEGNDRGPGIAGEDSPLLEDFEGGAGGDGSFGNLVRSNPLVKIGMVLGAFITIVLVVILFGGNEKPTGRSVVKGSSDVTEVPATEGASEKYREAVEESNVQAVEEAMRKGTSALPTPISPPVGRVPAGDALGDAEDPLERWRRLQEERQRRNRPAPKDLPETDPNVDAINSLADAMRQQMESILQSKQLKGPEYLKIADESILEQPEEADGAEGASGTGQQEEQIVNIIIPAGTVEYAQLLTEANSDTPGPILAQIVSGPLSGSRMLGTFTVENDEYLVLKFNTIVIDGVGHSIDALALDPQTTTPGLVTDIDNRYFSRVILPAAASFIEGMGEAIADTGGTSISVSGENVTSSEEDLNTREEVAKGVEKAAQKIGDILDDRAQQIKPLVRVEAGTPMGILFVEPVTDETSIQN